MIKEYEARAAELRKQFQQKRAAIQNNKNLSENGRANEIRQLANQTNAKLQELKTEFQTERKTRIEDLNGSLWSLGHKLSASENEKLMKQQQYRDAITKAETAKNAKELKTMMSRAQQLNDSLSMRAISFVARNEGVHDVARAGLDEDSRAQYDELRSLENPSREAKIYESAVFSRVPE